MAPPFGHGKNKYGINANIEKDEKNDEESIREIGAVSEESAKNSVIV